jgi:TRAP transporter TAXI family solute receptor
MKKLMTVVLALAMIAMPLFAQGDSEGSSSAPKRWSLGTSSSGGNFYLVGGGIATILNNENPDRFVITSEETGGSSANLSMIESGDLEIGIAMASALYQGKTGKAAWTNGKPMENVRGLVPLYPSFMTMYALQKSGISSLEDLNGKIVGLGSKGAAMDSVFREAFAKIGLEPGSIFNDGHSATARAVSEGQVDAAVLFSFPPFSAISELEATRDLTFIPLTEEEQDFFTESYPFWTKATMPKGSYNGVTEDLRDITEWNFLVCSADLPEEDVYQIAKTIFENNPDLLNIHRSLQYCTPENEQFFNVPLHPGVVKYLQEVGVEVPDTLLP